MCILCTCTCRNATMEEKANPEKNFNPSRTTMDHHCQDGSLSGMQKYRQP